MVFEDLPGEADEEELPRGDVTEGVVRVGSTVRRPAQPQSAAVADYLQHLARAGFGGAPRFLGQDQSGRDVVDFLPGEVAGDPPQPWAADDELLASVGRLLRALHDASEGYAADRGFTAPPGSRWFSWPSPSDAERFAGPAGPLPELVAHNDVTPQNVVVRDCRAVALIDFDMADPSRGRCQHRGALGATARPRRHVAGLVQLKAARAVEAARGRIRAHRHSTGVADGSRRGSR